MNSEEYDRGVFCPGFSSGPWSICSRESTEGVHRGSGSAKRDVSRGGENDIEAYGKAAAAGETKQQ